MNSAVLFLVFNRPGTTKKVFEAIRQAKPPRLYLSADGPRLDVLGEMEKSADVRQITSNVDWPCEVKTRFSDENMGCKLAVSSAIDWFFEQEDEGIILEDDVLPDPSFFSYCDALLEKYRDDESVATISGCNFISNHIDLDSSYFFSRYCHIWGWATWRRSWNLYDVNMKDWPSWKNGGGLELISDGSANFESYWREIFQSVSDGNLDTWDYQWIFRCWKNGSVSILPTYSLVENIGFGEYATHTTGHIPKYIRESAPREVSFPLIHPQKVAASDDIDRIITRYAYSYSFILRLAKSLFKIPILGPTLRTVSKYATASLR